MTVAAWLNQAGPAPVGTLDTLVEESGVRFVRHHIVDFDGLFGCGSDPGPKAPPGAMELFSKIGQLGFQRTAGVPARYRCLGRIDSESFQPESWEPVYSVGAFEQARPDDAFWAMRRIAAVTDDHLRALVAAAGFSEAAAARYLVETLAARREKLARHVFSRFLALDRFAVKGSRLVFHDLAGGEEPAVEWFHYDNAAQREQATGRGGPAVPAVPSEYLLARLTREGKRADVFLRRRASGWQVVGVERFW
jgi:hypothetical protein